MAIGFVLITLAVIAGSTWAFIELKTAWISQPKIAISFFTWGIYLALVFLRTTAGWRGRKAAIMTVAVLGFSALTWAAHARLGAMLLETMKLLITGVSHKTAPVEVRECLAFREESLPAALADLKAREGVAEAVILSTCNRVEITVTTDDRVDPQAVVDAFLADHKAIDPGRHRAAPLPARRPGRHPPPVPRGRQPGFHGGGRAADSGPAQGRLRRRQGLRRAVRLAGRPADARLQRGQARALGDRHRADGRLGELRRGGTGAQDFRHR